MGSWSFSSDTTRTRLRLFVQYLPVYCVLFILLSTWVVFVIFVSVGAVLKSHKDTRRFIIQLIVYHTLLGLSVTSYIAAVARRPLRPDQSLAPPDARPLLPDERPQFDDDDIPLRQLRDSRRERRHSRSEEAGDETALLDKDDEHISLMAKSGSGKPRWCRKCDGWKPDRCHHCRSCRQCVLKMDHHCPWLANCVGYHNYKPFMLFTSYTGLLSAYACYEAGWETFQWFASPLDYGSDDMDDVGLSILPVVFLLLTMLGFSMTIAIGGLSVYHWYLLLNNRTTLEQMDRTAPSALLNDEPAANAPGRQGPAWRPDHLLTRPERVRLRREGKELNVYDVGARENFRSVMFGDGVKAPETWSEFGIELARAAWPLVAPRQKRYGAGHFFAHDPAKVEQLRTLTCELRLGVEPRPGADGRAESFVGGDWEESGSDTDSERTMYE